MSAVNYVVGDVFEHLAELPDNSVDLVLTSPPFLALRSYLPADHPAKHKEIGSEPTPAEFIDTLLMLVAEWDRVLAPHGSIAVELGDTYAGSGGAGGDYNDGGLREGQNAFKGSARKYVADGWPLSKSLCGIPQLFEIALAYGINPLTGAESPAGKWRVRNMVAWCRPNPAVGALGDKYRPATSYMTIATRATDRYFDLDAVRVPASNRSTLADVNPTADATRPPYDHVGLLDGEADLFLEDGWLVSTESYSGSHYATWPRKLLDRPILAMCPQKVCTVCGEPSRRIAVTTNSIPHTSERRDKQERRANYDETNSWAKAAGVAHTIRETLGWSDCGHGSYACATCNVVVPYGDAVRRSRKTQTGKAGVGEAPLLGEPVQGAGVAPDGTGGVRNVQRGVSGSSGSSMLHPELFSEAGASRGAGEHDPAADSNAWAEDQPGRVRARVGPGGDAWSTKERLHDGASPGDAGASRPSARAVGDRPSPQRGEGGQPDREPGSRDEGTARRDGAVPPLPGDVPGQLTWSCPHCACTELSYVEDHWRRGVVLDPFGGSGTTGQVAAAHGRDAILIDLDARNLELARERVGMFLTEGWPASLGDHTPRDEHWCVDHCPDCNKGEAFR